MNARELLAELRGAGARLRVDSERLVCDAPTGVLSDEIKAEIRRHKAELIGLLCSESSPEIPKIGPAADSSRVAAAIRAAEQAGGKRSHAHYRMRGSWVARLLLAPLYRFKRRWLRRSIHALVSRLEGGPMFSRTLREVYARHHDIHVGDYTTGGAFRLGNVKPGTRIGRYTIVTDTARFETANHPINTYSSNAIFYRAAFGFAEEFEIPRSKIAIGSDVFIGHNATILYPCSGIGDGAVIGAHAVVDFDVPPFAVVSGNPAAIVRYRFSKQKIEELLSLRWWDAALEALEPVRDQFQLPVEGRRVR